MPKYVITNSTAKIGINYLRSIVECHNCIFQKIDQENDVGIDALIEIVKNEQPTGKFIATQIKSGNSYFDKTESLCKIPIGSHREYWAKYQLPVYGIVYIPEYDSAYWIDIKHYLKENPTATVISYKATLANIITKNTFTTQFIPYLIGEIPDISYDLATKLFQSSNSDEFYLGLYTLFKRYANKNEVWDALVGYFKSHPVDEIPGKLIYYLAIIPWHGDMYYYRDSYTEESRKHGQLLLNEFSKEDIVKLLRFVDEDNMISRGTLGQCVEAIVSAVPNFASHLEYIIKDNTEDLHIREVAAIIYAFHIGKKGVNVLSSIPSSESWYINELIQYLKKYGRFNPYI